MAFLKTSLVFTTPISWYGAFICFSFLKARMRKTSWDSRRCLLSFGRTRCLNYAPFPACRQYETAPRPHEGTNSPDGLGETIDSVKHLGIIDPQITQISQIQFHVGFLPREIGQ